jgi:hypothetical protein
VFNLNVRNSHPVQLTPDCSAADWLKTLIRREEFHRCALLLLLPVALLLAIIIAAFHWLAG